MLDELLKEIQDTPDYIIEQAILYIKFLKANPTMVPHDRKHPKREFGTLKGKIIMAPDFDETPECFQEYM